jgi:hypothetical protein
MIVIEGPSFEWKGGQSTTTATEDALNQRLPRSFAEAADTHEILIGDNNLRPIAFIERGAEVARAVAQIIVPGAGVGTGFLVGANLLLTNNHVIPDESVAATCLARFNYELGIDGSPLPSTYINVDPNQVFHTSIDLDYTLVALQGNGSIRFGQLPLVAQAVQVGDAVNIIQHPGGNPKEIAFVDNQVMYVDDKLIQYLTDTLPGSSGSPVCDNNWNVVALHHSGGWIPQPSSTSTHFRNEGIAIGAIISDLVSAGLARSPS